MLCLNNCFALAGTMGEIDTKSPGFYLGVEGGASISAQTQFGQDFYKSGQRFVAPVNSDFSRDIGSAGFGGLFLGYNYNPNLAVQFTWDYRRGYDYNLHTSYGGDFGRDYLEDRFETRGNINVQTFLFDLVLKPSLNWGGFVPYVKGGIGLSYNEMGTFRNVDLATPPTFDTNVSGATRTSFAWDAGVGADYMINHNTSIGLGYRFVDAGQLQTSSRWSDPLLGEAGSRIPFGTKHLYLNEVVASIAYHFDYA